MESDRTLREKDRIFNMLSDWNSYYHVLAAQEKMSLADLIIKERKAAVLETLDRIERDYAPVDPNYNLYSPMPIIREIRRDYE